MAVFIGAVQYGNFGKGTVSRRAWLIANYVEGSGYKGVTLREIEGYLKRQSTERVTREKIYAALRMLFRNGYYFDDKKDWRDTIVYENRKFWTGRR